MSKFFAVAALGLGLFAAGHAAQAAPAPHPGVTPVHYQGGPHWPHYAPPHHGHHRYVPPPPPRHHGWHAPVHRPQPRPYGWR